MLKVSTTLLHHFYVSQKSYDDGNSRVAKCHGYIRVKILAGCGQWLAEHAILKNQAFLRKFVQCMQDF